MYIFISSLIFFFSLLFWSQDRDFIAVRYTFLFILLLLIFLDGFRWNIGTDWRSYYDYFSSHSIDSYYEIGYSLFSFFISSLTDNYTIFILIIAIIQYFTLAFFIQKFSINPLVSLCIAYSIYLPLLGMNRQFIALSITLVSVVFIVKRKIIPYILLIVCACFFHKSASFFFPAYLLWNKQIDKKIIIGVLLGALIIGELGVLNFLPLEYLKSLIGDRHLQTYLDSSSMSSMLKGVLFRIFIIVPCFFITIP